MEILEESGLRIFGRDFINRAEVNTMLSNQGGTPTIALSPQELLLVEASKRGEFPLYREDKTPDGKPLTMRWMVEALQARFDEKNWGQILYGPSLDWCRGQSFFMEDTPRKGWALVSKAPIPNSTRKNYWEQTELLARLVGNVYEGREVPDLYKDALNEWGKEKDRLNRILLSNWREAAKGLAELQINQHLREKPVEALFDVLFPFMKTEERRLVDLYTLTNAITSGGHLVGFGFFDSFGAFVYDWYPYYAYPDVGVCSNRSIL